MECEAEFTPLTRWLSRPKECIRRGKYRDQSASVSEQAGRPAVSRVAKPENCGRHVWVSKEKRDGKRYRRLYRIAPAGRKALGIAREKVSELFGELFEHKGRRGRQKAKARR